MPGPRLPPNRDRYSRSEPDAECGGCRFWVALHGHLGRDYGACTNADSPFDGQVRFEHDGCAAYADREDGSFGQLETGSRKIV
ncbi:DUF3027 domain-containing protein [Planosporangium sp. 12N6]|uniref:DUF3027 domain-containing protein n=1 Tax=Planosporangium spinosum TaxID=3402278 RepID=UPI003CEC6EEF